MSNSLRVKELAKKFDEWEARQQKDASKRVDLPVPQRRLDAQKQAELPDESPSATPSVIDQDLQEEVLQDFQEDISEGEQGEVEEGEEEAGSVSENGAEDHVVTEKEGGPENDAGRSHGDDKPSQDYGRAVETEATEMSKFNLPPDQADGDASYIGMSTKLVQLYTEGINCYAFVKQNAGMLKPVRLFLHPKAGRLYIVRKKADQVHSLFLHVRYFGEVDAQPGSLQYLNRNSQDPLLTRTVNDLDSMPHVVIWTNDDFNAEQSHGTRRRGLLGVFRRKARKSAVRRSLVFIFEEELHRDALCQLIEATARTLRVDSLIVKKART